MAIFCLFVVHSANAQHDEHTKPHWHTEPELGTGSQADLHITHADTVHNPLMLLYAVPAARISNEKFTFAPFFHSSYVAFGTTLMHQTTPRLSFYVISHRSLTRDHFYTGLGSEAFLIYGQHHKAFAEIGSVLHELEPVFCAGVSFDLCVLLPHKHATHKKPIF